MHVRTVGIIAILILLLIVASSPSDAQPRGHIPVVGVLSPATSEVLSDPKRGVYAFLQGLRELGYVEGQTLRLEYRFADSQWDRLPSLAVALVQQQPNVIVTHTTPGALAAKQATTTIPIVVMAADDLAQLGIVASLARPGGNITGQSLRDLELAGKRLELLKDAAPTITQVAVLADPNGPGYSQVPSAFAQEAHALGVQLQRVDAGTLEAIGDALARIAHSGAEALMIMDASMFNAHRQRILEFARTHRLPTVCGVRAYAEAGCLIAYAPDILEMFRRAAVFVDKILKGTKPGDLPVEQPAKFELIINLKTATDLGLTLPPTLLFQANEVIR
jgi:putative tryptophan/tyrosine transport system substrate-binding protein